jgi:hypothetical protein
MRPCKAKHLKSENTCVSSLLLLSHGTIQHLSVLIMQ